MRLEIGKDGVDDFVRRPERRVLLLLEHLKPPEWIPIGVAAINRPFDQVPQAGKLKVDGGVLHAGLPSPTDVLVRMSKFEGSYRKRFKLLFEAVEKGSLALD